jgi:hypothetical protein
MTTSYVPRRSAERPAGASDYPLACDSTFAPDRAVSGDPGAAYRAYADILAGIADAIDADAARRPAIRNTLALIVRGIRDAAGDCAGVASSREAA